MIARRGIGIGILTRNTRLSVIEALKNFSTVSEKDFKVIITRESAGRPKPHPDGVFGAAQHLDVVPREMLVVGDFIFDIAAGKAAGAPTVFLTNGRLAAPCEPAPDFTIENLMELGRILGL
jgi:HAD superfamily hydrolase (TIGR01509 family)